MDSINDNLPLEAVERLDRLADQFEAEFASGCTPSVIEYAKRLPEYFDQAVIELVRLEAELRRDSGVTVEMSEFLHRYPNHQSQVASALTLEAQRDEQPNDRAPGVLADGVLAEGALADSTEGGLKQIGRYQIHRLLGEGGYGSVYQAHDMQLGRLVAAKVPRQEQLITPEQRAQFVAEARTAANLKHPQLVAVYDILIDNGQVCIIQEFIDGTSLKHWARQKQRTAGELIALFVQICRPLEYLHEQGFAHCDLKLENVLIDRSGLPHVADFGMAIKANSHRMGRSVVFGTPRMMAPEQVRGEVHRIDGRTDVWALGAMLFEVAFGRRPFAGASQREIFDRILRHDPPAMDDVENTRQQAIQEICVRCLSKRMQDRFPSVGSLRGEFERWLARYQAGAHQTADGRELRLPTPRGLRSFDAEDADFFLALLPGPRCLDGLPELLSFWKARIDGAARARSFPVGLLYGPSGCGKSSFVKAGLLPRLDPRVQCVYVESEEGRTEARVRAKLASTHPDIDESESLAGVFAVAREQAKHSGSTMLVVIDQFEQWLSDNWDLANSELVDALRQCDGQHLQVLLLVRDDFYLSVNRLFLELEVSLEERFNQAVVDLFSVKHAEAVVLRFGQGIGRLGSSFSTQDRAFAAALVELIARDGRVVCVHLALLLEMLKDLPWEIQSIDELGDFNRIGQAYLVRTFDSRTAQPAHRANRRLVRSLLASLLPVPGAEIRGSAKSTVELLSTTPDPFDRNDVERGIRILDQELRLITPVDPATPDKEALLDARPRSYQLTHDYLVPSIREWLTQHQRMTTTGRAELYLRQSAQLWQQRRDKRLLAGYFGWLRLQLLTDHSSWNRAERGFMRASAKAIARKTAFGLVAASLVIGGFAFWVASWKRETQHQELLSAVASVKNAESMLIQDAVTNLTGKRFPADAVLAELSGAREGADGRQRFRLACAMAALREVPVEFLIDQIPSLSPLELESLLWALSFDMGAARQRLQDAAAETDNFRAKARLAMVALRLGDPEIGSEMTDVQHIDPAARSVFIDECSRWNGDLRKLSRIVAELDDPSLQTALCLAMGSTPAAYMALQSDVTQEVGGIMADLFVTSTDRGVHSAAAWVLEAWHLAVPRLEGRAEPPSDLSWYVDLAGLTLLCMHPGQFTSQPNHLSVKVTRGFWLADREVTIGQFTAYAHDETCPFEFMLGDWRGPEVFDRTSDDHPVQRVSWDEAASYCNWLSWKHALEPCYEWNGSHWEWIRDTNGYRLPTEAEWEYACRAGTETTYCFGENDDGFLNDYAVFHARMPGKTGTRLPNGWGLFDMHCNVWEWCNDWYAPYPDQDVLLDPRGPSVGDGKVHRGGDCFDSAERCRSSHRYGYNPAIPERNIGFRVARSIITPR